MNRVEGVSENVWSFRDLASSVVINKFMGPRVKRSAHARQEGEYIRDGIALDSDGRELERRISIGRQIG